jgi:hypothetical protein
MVVQQSKQRLIISLQKMLLMASLLVMMVEIGQDVKPVTSEFNVYACSVEGWRRAPELTRVRQATC